MRDRTVDSPDAARRPAWLRRFERILGASGLVTEADALAPRLTEWRGLYRGEALALLRPQTTAQVSDILAFCHAEHVGVVPQGGNTGLVGGAIPHSRPGSPQVILSAERLDRIRELDAANYSLTAEAGCILANLQAEAERAERLFPLSLAAEGSCQLGGNIATNAGGTNVLRYGNARDLVLGLEVVLPDGRVLDDLRALRKDNTGYDLKQLFIGSEGTLGFITAATCKLFPLPRDLRTALVAVETAESAVELFTTSRVELGDRMNAFELISGVAFDLVLRHVDRMRDPFNARHTWYVLIENAGAELEALLTRQLEAGRISDAVLAQSDTQRQELWRMRHSISEAQKRAGAGIKHDISVPVSRVPQFLHAGEQLVRRLVPGAVLVAFGHLGDGNIHFNVNQPENTAAKEFLSRWSEVSREVHSLAVEMGGSFSAEHGIGELKKAELRRLAGSTELDLMRAIKQVLDPHGIMNPGKVLAGS